MVSIEEVGNLRGRILARIAEIARSGNVPELMALTARANECERLLRDFRDIEDRWTSLSTFGQSPAPLDPGQPTLSAPGARSAKRDGAMRRAQWVDALKAKGIVLRGSAKRYTTGSGVTVGLAFANERPERPDKWFLGLANESTEIAVLLCRSRAGRMYDLVIPVATLGRAWDLLSRSRGQIKFNVAKERAEIYLQIPGTERLNVTQYLSDYEPLRHHDGQ